MILLFIVKLSLGLIVYVILRAQGTSGLQNERTLRKGVVFEVRRQMMSHFSFATLTDFFAGSAQQEAAIHEVFVLL